VSPCPPTSEAVEEAALFQLSFQKSKYESLYPQTVFFPILWKPNQASTIIVSIKEEILIPKIFGNRLVMVKWPPEAAIAINRLIPTIPLPKDSPHVLHYNMYKHCLLVYGDASTILWA